MITDEAKFLLTHKDIAEEDKTYKLKVWTDQDDQLDGEQICWWSNGKMRFYSSFKEDKLDGELKMWFRNGQLRLHCFCKNGDLNGEAKRWRKDGKLSKHRFYKDDKKVADFLANPELKEKYGVR